MSGFTATTPSASSHIPGPWIDAYAAGEQGPADLWWAVEAHLETCATCRERLADAVTRRSPKTAALVERVGTTLAAQVAASPRPAPMRRPRVAGTARAVRRWLAPGMAARLTTTLLVLVAAVTLDLTDAATSGRFPSIVLLVAPVAPLVGVAAAWSRRLDPAHEIVVASSRAGLELVLRRALVALGVAVPALIVAGWIVGAAPVRWLLPCVAFVLAALALGAFVGLRRAAAGLALTWVVVVVAPSLLSAETPAALEPGAAAGWAVAIVAVAALLVVNRREFTNLGSAR